MTTNFHNKQETNNGEPLTENGVTQVVCEIGQVPIWSSNLKLLPNIEQCDILFIKKCDWNDDIDRLKLYKKDNGNALFTSHASYHQIYNEEPALIKLNGPFHFYRE